MKAVKSIQILAVMLVLVTAATGCKKRPQNTTPLPGSRVAMTGSDPRGPLDNGTALRTTPDEGLKSTEIPGNPDGSYPPTDPGVMLTWPQNRDAFAAQTVYFDFDKSNVRASELPKLETVAEKMKTTYAGQALLIEGHADERGTEEYNRALGERRALAVRETLAKLGLDPSRVVTLTLGEDQPADPAHNEAAWSKNRRGQIILLTPPSAPVAGTP